MRAILMTFLLATLALAGCLDSGEQGTDSETTEGEQAWWMQDAANRTEKPEKRFEPIVTFEADEVEIEQGSTAAFTFDISDLQDYDYPIDFIDWNVTYSRSPNAVEEGDASELPGDYAVTLHAETFHVFKFNFDDGQGFNGTEEVIVQVGEPCEEDSTQWGCPDYVDPNAVGDSETPSVPVNDPCADASVQDTQEEAGKPVIIGGAAGSGFIYRWEFTVEECQNVIDAEVVTTYGDIMLDIEDPSGSVVAATDANFVGGESLRIEAPAGKYFEAGAWNLYIRPFASGPDVMDFSVAFE